MGWPTLNLSTDHGHHGVLKTVESLVFSHRKMNVQLSLITLQALGHFIQLWYHGTKSAQAVPLWFGVNCISWAALLLYKWKTRKAIKNVSLSGRQRWQPPQNQPEFECCLISAGHDTPPEFSKIDLPVGRHETDVCALRITPEKYIENPPTKQLPADIYMKRYLLLQARERQPSFWQEIDPPVRKVPNKPYLAWGHGFNRVCQRSLKEGTSRTKGSLFASIRRVMIRGKQGSCGLEDCPISLGSSLLPFLFGQILQLIFCSRQLQSPSKFSRQGKLFLVFFGKLPNFVTTFSLIKVFTRSKVIPSRP